MNCTSFREVVHEMDRDGLLDASAYEAAVAHAQTCTRCARLLYQTRRLDGSLGALARADHDREPAARVYGQLLQAFRAQAPVKIEPRRVLRWLGAAAAVLILAGGAVLAWRHARLSRANPATLATLVRSTPAAGSVEAPGGVQAEVEKPLQTPGARSQAKAGAPRTATEPDEIEDQAEFIPLPYADEDAPLGAGEMVRVRLSESALGVLGLPVTEESNTQAVTADIVIGEDGVARAIRFVSGPVPAELAELRNSTSDNKGVKP
jgi:hypothetical protein